MVIYDITIKKIDGDTFNIITSCGVSSGDLMKVIYKFIVEEIPRFLKLDNNV